jgi:hypothetical protein
MLAARKVLRVGLLAIGYLSLAYFAFGIYLTCKVLAGIGAWRSLAFLAPYLGIVALFATATCLAHTGRLTWGAILLALALLGSIGACAFDLANHRCQITGGGTGETYTIWWWYYEPLWYGYKPGNV